VVARAGLALIVFAWSPVGLLAASALPARAQAPLGATAQAIVQGTDDPGDAGVVALALTRSGWVFCTGTLISPRVVLTSAHCVFDMRADEITVVFGADPKTGARMPVLQVRLAPRFGLARQSVDLGVLLLAEPSPAPPWPVLPSPLDDSLLGHEVRLAGYGVTEGHLRVADLRRQGTAALEEIGDLDLRIRAAPASVCFGDSGGPAFLTRDGVEYLLGVTIGGDCATATLSARVDPHRQNFLLPYLAETAPGAGSVGQRCLFPDHCRSGLACTPAVDEPILSFCTTACRGDADCPAGMRCAGDAQGQARCVWPRPSPGALGSPCSFTPECARGFCVQGSVSGFGRCKLQNESCAAAPGRAHLVLGGILTLLAWRLRRATRRPARETRARLGRR
jgi:hypothetical protein